MPLQQVPDYLSWDSRHADKDVTIYALITSITSLATRRLLTILSPRTLPLDLVFSEFRNIVLCFSLLCSSPKIFYYERIPARICGKIKLLFRSGKFALKLKGKICFSPDRDFAIIADHSACHKPIQKCLV